MSQQQTDGTRAPRRGLVGAVMGQPLHVRAMWLFLFHSFVMSTATVTGIQLVLPTIMDEFDVPVTTAVWVSIAYYVALSGSTVALGGVTKYFDRRKLVIFGLVADVVLMVITFYTHDIWVFIVCRFLSPAVRVFPWLILQVIGVGGFPPEQRGKAVGYNTLVQGLGLLAALPFTGFMLEHVGWRWMFMGTAVIYAAMVPVVLAMLPPLPPDESEERPPLSQFDFLGSILMVVGVVAVLTSLQILARGLEGGALPALLGVAGVAALAGFVWVETHAKVPILQFGLFRNPIISMAACQAVLMGFANGAFLLMLPFFFIVGVGWSAGHVSNVLLFQNLTRPVSGPVGGRLTDRFGAPRVILPAAVVAVSSQVALALMGTDPVVQVVMAILLFFGTGQALMQTANLSQLYAALPVSQLHLAPSINLTVMTLGTTSGQAFGSLAVERAQDATDTAAGFVDQMGVAMFLVTGLFVVGLVVTQLLPRLVLRRRRAIEPADDVEPVDALGAPAASGSG